MRLLTTLVLCLVAGGCSIVSELQPIEVGFPPNEAQLRIGINTVVMETHFKAPIEASDVFRAPSLSTEPWLVCIRNGASEETRRLTYSLFFAKDGQYVRSHSSE